MGFKIIKWSIWSFCVNQTEQQHLSSMFAAGYLGKPFAFLASQLTLSICDCICSRALTIFSTQVGCFSKREKIFRCRLHCIVLVLFLVLFFTVLHSWFIYFLSLSLRQCHIGSERKWCRVTTTGLRGTTGARGSVATGLHPSTMEWPVMPAPPLVLHLLMETTGLASFLFLLSPPSCPRQSPSL